jgi:hypothetical protein
MFMMLSGFRDNIIWGKIVGIGNAIDFPGAFPSSRRKRTTKAAIGGDPYDKLWTKMHKT